MRQPLHVGFLVAVGVRRMENSRDLSSHIYLTSKNLALEGWSMIMSQVLYQSLLTHRLLPKKREKQEESMLFILLKNVRRSENMPSKMATKELGFAFSPNFLTCMRAPSEISRQLISSALKRRRSRLSLCQLQHFHVSQGVGHLYYWNWMKS